MIRAHLASYPPREEMLRQMLQSEWLEEPKRSDYQRVYYLDSRAELFGAAALSYGRRREIRRR